MRKFKTHEEIDEHYRKQGVDVGKLNDEFNQVGAVLENEQKRAIHFLKKKMGLFKYYLWTFSCFPFGPDMSYGFGKDGYLEKAKEYGFKDNIDFATREIMEVD